MKINKILLVVTFITNSIANSIDISSVEQFEKLKNTKSGYHNIVQFFRPECSDCKNIAKAWEIMSDKFSYFYINFYKVNMSNKELMPLKDSLNITNYPIIIYKDGKEINKYVEPKPEELESIIFENCLK